MLPGTYPHNYTKDLVGNPTFLRLNTGIYEVVKFWSPFLHTTSRDLQISKEITTPSRDTLSIKMLVYSY